MQQQRAVGGLPITFLGVHLCLLRPGVSGTVLEDAVNRVKKCTQPMERSNNEQEIKITLSIDTVTKLKSGGYYLYGLKAVKSSGTSGRPLIWLQSQFYAESTYISLMKQYQAYTSNSDIVPNGQIRVGFSPNIGPGQILEVGPDGQGPVVGGGQPTAISILNKTITQFTCGISAKQNSSFSPLCAFPLYGGNLQTIVPVEKVLLLFSTRVLNAGTVIGHNLAFARVFAADGPGILVDVDKESRNVNYDINQGWSWGGFSWARSVAANQDLVSLLIESERGPRRGHKS